ncbi:MAG: hypothetical protein II393_01940 [Cytophagales bacterium]|nr:hypothetical protein [Cytophagales bacterium]
MLPKSILIVGKVVFASAVLTFCKRVLLFFVNDPSKMSLMDFLNIIFDKKEFIYDTLSFVLVFFILDYIIKKL